MGPFLAKSLSTFVSPWIVTTKALAPFRTAQPPRPAGDPWSLLHTNDVMDQAHGCFAIDFQVLLSTPKMLAEGAAPHPLSRSNAAMLYWTAAQMVAHHTSNGCNLQPGDLFGSGTVSGTGPGTEGCLLEMTRGGRNPIALPRRDGHAPIGFGECRGTVTEALALR